MSSQTIGNCVRELRTGKGLTQEQLAECVGVARQSIIAIERGHFLPSIETALRISAALGVPVERLFWLVEDRVK